MVYCDRDMGTYGDSFSVFRTKFAYFSCYNFGCGDFIDCNDDCVCKN